MSERVPEILFVCVQNAGRSQMASGAHLYQAAIATVAPPLLPAPVY
jgi:protein-tyrosine-phosphatase